MLFNEVSVVIVTLLHPKLSSLRNDRSINLNLSDHARCFCGGKYDDRSLQIKKNQCFICVNITRYDRDTW